MQKAHAAATLHGRFSSGFRAALLGLLCTGLFALMLLAPAQGMGGARSGLALCGDVIVPSLFPFLALSVFVIRTGLAQRFGRLLEKPVRAVFRLPGSAAAALGLGMIGGYPVGAKACADLYRAGALDKNEAERLLAFCINSSPAFIIGAVGAGLMGSTQAGVLLYIAHIFASLVIGCILCAPIRPGKYTRKNEAIQASPVPEAFVQSVVSAAGSIVNICAFVVLFSTLVSLIADTGLLNAFSRIPGVPDTAFLTELIKGFLEVSNGCAGAAAHRNLYGVLFLSAFLSWSGLSVIFQVAYAVRDAGLSIRYYVLCRLPHMLLSVVVTAVLFRLFPVAIPTFAAHAQQLMPAVHSAPSSVALLLVCSMLLLSRVKV